MRLTHHEYTSSEIKRESRTLISPTDPRFGVVLDDEFALPYGYWKTSDGEIVLFDRRYRPMFIRLRGGKVVRSLPYWVDYARTVYLWPNRRRTEEDLARLTMLLMTWTRAAVHCCRGVTYTRRELLPPWTRKDIDASS